MHFQSVSYPLKKMPRKGRQGLALSVNAGFGILCTGFSECGLCNYFHPSPSLLCNIFAFYELLVIMTVYVIVVRLRCNS